MAACGAGFMGGGMSDPNRFRIAFNRCPAIDWRSAGVLLVEVGDAVADSMQRDAVSQVYDPSEMALAKANGAFACPSYDDLLVTLNWRPVYPHSGVFGLTVCSANLGVLPIDSWRGAFDHEGQVLGNA